MSSNLQVKTLDLAKRLARLRLHRRLV